jgi:hypothetical protein
VRVAREVAVEHLGVPALLPVVELESDRAGELVDDLARVDEVERTHALLDDPRRLLEELDVALDLARGVRPLHLHRDAPAVREHRPMHLADRRRGHRLRLELDEQPLDRQVEVLGDDALHVREREGRDVVLEAAELRDDVRRHDVGPRREQLPELDEGRAELVQHLAQVAPARGRAVCGCTPAVEDEPEAMAHCHLGDLAQAPDARGLRPGGHTGVLQGVRGRIEVNAVPDALGITSELGAREKAPAPRAPR